MNQLARTDTQLATVADSRGLQLRNMGEIMEFCTTIANSGLAPKDFKTPEAIFMVVQHGMELGISPSQALQGSCVINGRVSIFGDLALAVASSHPDFEDINETFERGNGEEGGTAKCEIHRKGRTPVIRTFSQAQAKKAGLWGKAGPWTQFPQRMLQLRARSWAMRDAFPDALKGVGITEEARDIEPRQANAREVKPLVLPGDEPAPVVTEVKPEPGPDEDVKKELNPDGSFKF